MAFPLQGCHALDAHLSLSLSPSLSPVLVFAFVFVSVSVSVSVFVSWGWQGRAESERGSLALCLNSSGLYFLFVLCSHPLRSVIARCLSFAMTPKRRTEKQAPPSVPVGAP